MGHPHFGLARALRVHEMRTREELLFRFFLPQNTGEGMLQESAAGISSVFEVLLRGGSSQ